jgi:hypothetical protein
MSESNIIKQDAEPRIARPKRGRYRRRREMNALRHGLYTNFDRLDGRSIEASQIRHGEMVLATALGGDTTPQEAAVCRTVAVSMWRLSIVENLMVEAQRQSPPDWNLIEKWDNAYRQWSQHVREGLRMIGLDRRDAQVPDLQAYLASKTQLEPTSREIPASDEVVTDAKNSVPTTTFCHKEVLPEAQA